MSMNLQYLGVIIVALVNKIVKTGLYLGLSVTILACSYQNQQSTDEKISTEEEESTVVEEVVVADSVTKNIKSEQKAKSGKKEELSIRFVDKRVAGQYADKRVYKHLSMPNHIVPVPHVSREKYQSLTMNDVKLTQSEPVSTFSIDVDTGAYSNVRRFLNNGQLPNENAVRLEEMVNYFDYQYQTPKTQSVPFVVSSSMMATPWNKKTQLLSVAIKGWQQEVVEIPPMNLVFLVDVSGSMHSQDKLPLVKKSLTMLTKHLDEKDKVAVVVYAGNSSVVLPSTQGDKKGTILAALEKLQSGGGTNGSAGIETAYQIAADNFIKEGVNRVLLATDGDFNVGISDREELIALIEKKRDAGIFLNTLGYGTGNYNDHLMEQLADKGNGNYAYIDSLFEAKKVLVDEIAASFMTIAKDVKIQLEFNPDVVHEYRLLGYENRALNEADFSNDKVDAGEVGAGHTVTALYELSLTNSDFKRLGERRYSKKANNTSQIKSTKFNGELGLLKLRYKKPQASESKLISKILKVDTLKSSGKSDANTQFAAAVAAFAQTLKDDKYLQSFSFDDIIQLANRNRKYDPYGRKAEFIQLVSLAKELKR